jgi:hypothetical protein
VDDDDGDTRGGVDGGGDARRGRLKNGPNNSLLNLSVLYMDVWVIWLAERTLSHGKARRL